MTKTVRITLSIVGLGLAVAGKVEPAAAQAAGAYGVSAGYAPELVLNGNIFVRALARGIYRNDGTAFGYGYYTGSNAIGQTFHSYFVFDLPEVQIFSASLRLYTGGLAGAPVNINFFAYSGSVTTLTTLTPSTAVYADLGDGTIFGNRTYTTSDANTWLNVDLNQYALAEMSGAQGGVFALGGAEGSNPANAIVNPEPISMILLGTGLAGVGAVRRRRRREDEDGAIDDDGALA